MLSLAEHRRGHCSLVFEGIQKCIPYPLRSYQCSFPWKRRDTTKGYANCSYPVSFVLGYIPDKAASIPCWQPFEARIFSCIPYKGSIPKQKRLVSLQKPTSSVPSKEYVLVSFKGQKEAIRAYKRKEGEQLAASRSLFFFWDIKLQENSYYLFFCMRTFYFFKNQGRENSCQYPLLLKSLQDFNKLLSLAAQTAHLLFFCMRSFYSFFRIGYVL